MKNLFISALIIISFISCKNETKQKTVTETSKPKTKEASQVKPAKTITSTIVWKGYKPTGSHNGTINVKSTDFKFEGDNLVGGSIIIDMNTIKNIDIKDLGDNKHIVDHLKSADFFDVAKYPTAKFKITKVESDKEGKQQITGNFTLNGVTKELNFPTSIITLKTGKKLLKSNVIKINRTDYGIKYKSKKFFSNLKDKFINDEFDIAFKIVLK